MKTPEFWGDDKSIVSQSLSPIGRLYGTLTGLRMNQQAQFKAKVPVICCGNLIAGGAGKTPSCIAIGGIAKRMGAKIGFLTRGYGGHKQSKPCVVDVNLHNAKEVGDEPLLLARYGVCVVCVDRIEGAKRLVEEGVNLIIMDDGFQNPALHKDYNLVVVDGQQGVGNGRCMPAGPLRAPVTAQMRLAHGLLVLGNGEGVTIEGDVDRFKGERVIVNADQFNGTRILAYTGIANTTQFFRQIEKCGGEIVVAKSFGDHHLFSDAECEKLIGTAKEKDLMLVTTEKDLVRLEKSTEIAQDLYNKSIGAVMEMKFENEKMIEKLIGNIIS